MATATEQGEIDGKLAATGEMLEEAIRVLSTSRTGRALYAWSDPDREHGEHRLRIYAYTAAKGAADASDFSGHDGYRATYGEAWAKAFVTEVCRVRYERAAHEDTRQ